MSLHSTPTRSTYQAAVIDPRIHSKEVVERSARQVPARAKRIEIGTAQAGYILRASAPPSFAARRLKELEHLIELRHGGPVTTDDGAVYLAIATQVAVALARETTLSRRDPETAIRNFACGWVRRWLPLVDDEAVAHAIDFAMSKPRTWRADNAARILRLTLAERTAAGIVTIGAIDADKDERARLAKERHAERQRKARAAARDAGETKSRDDYIASSVAAECRRLGISRTTYYRRKAAEAAGKVACNRWRAASKKISEIAHATCNAPLPTRDGSTGAMRAQARPRAPLSAYLTVPTPREVFRWWVARYAPPIWSGRRLQ